MESCSPQGVALGAALDAHQFTLKRSQTGAAANCSYSDHGRTLSIDARAPQEDKLPTISPTRNKFFKTRLCPYHFKKGSSCKGKENCSYAHSFTELRPSVDLTKTKFCLEYLHGNCKRPLNECPFAHGELDHRGYSTRQSHYFTGHHHRGHSTVMDSVGGSFGYGGHKGGSPVYSSGGSMGTTNGESSNNDCTPDGHWKTGGSWHRLGFGSDGGSGNLGDLLSGVGVAMSGSFEQDDTSSAYGRYAGSRVQPMRAKTLDLPTGEYPAKENKEELNLDQFGGNSSSQWGGSAKRGMDGLKGASFLSENFLSNESPPLLMSRGRELSGCSSTAATNSMQKGLSLETTESGDNAFDDFTIAAPIAGAPSAARAGDSVGGDVPNVQQQHLLTDLIEGLIAQVADEIVALNHHAPEEEEGREVLDRADSLPSDFQDSGEKKKVVDNESSAAAVGEEEKLEVTLSQLVEIIGIVKGAIDSPTAQIMDSVCEFLGCKKSRS